MSCERALDDIVTEFLVSTCRLRPQPRKYGVWAAALCSGAAKQAVNDADTEITPLITGSVAEFYIEPMLPHVGDIDVMFYLDTELAIPRGHPPPTQLGPAEFHNYVYVLEIIDSHLHGYVYLELRYLLTQCSDDGNYNAVQCDREQYLLNRLGIYHGTEEAVGHGPAVSSISKNPELSFDIVRCVRCLVWPPQAADWPTRHRNCGWPDSATLDSVVSNGCDVVGVAHRQCRKDEWMSKHQQRLSFSRAEIVLINSWMPVQQIVLCYDIS